MQFENIRDFGRLGVGGCHFLSVGISSIGSLCSQGLANFGQWVSGIVSFAGIPFVIFNFIFTNESNGSGGA
ncbi:hypothetical protein [Bdellovibrio sp. HCB288]|uniref:hypothetical protein n=1 Tax=Bdellovibrio sp. HCB288 TaxID=3394355 RepID=UPI0039B68C1A